MARRNVLQEIPILVPQTEQQSYEIVSEDEGSIPCNKQISSDHRLHSRYISNDESKENITPTQFEDILKKSQVKVSESSNVSLLGDGPDPTGPDHTSDAGDTVTPKRKPEGSPEDLQPPNTPMDFSTVTVDDLGISSESFTTKCAGKSPKSLHKHRRRSTIGVRGSPEMNFLIRQIALQRSNRKSEPEPLDNPFSSPRNSILRDKITAFRNAFQAVEETDGKLSFPGFSEAEELQSEEEKIEVTSEPPEKRKKVCDPPDTEVSGVLHEPAAALCPSEALGSSQSVLLKPVPEETLESDSSVAPTLSAEVPSKPVEGQSDEAQILPTSRLRKRKVMFTGLLSPPEPKQSPPPVLEVSSGPALKPALKKTPRREFVHFRVGFGEKNRAYFSSQECSDNEENEEDSVMKKKVTFGRELSPELFDKTLPANTPLRRGSTPYNHQKLEATPSAAPSGCRSPCDPLPQPDFSDKEEEETLQPLSLCFDTEASDSDSPASTSLPEHKEECNPIEDEAAVDSSGSTDNEVVESEETSEEIGTTADADMVDESFIASPEVLSAGMRALRSSNKRKLSRSEKTPESNGLKAPMITKVKSIARKSRKLVIIKKAQVKATRGRGKKKVGRPKKSVQKAVSSEREGVSKKPLLSPIPELPESIPTPPASTSWDSPYGKDKHLKKVCTQGRAGKVQESEIFKFLDPLERINKEKDNERPPLCVDQTQDAPVDPALKDLEASDNGSPEKSDGLHVPDLEYLAPQANPVSSKCPQSLADMEITDQLYEQATSGVAPSSEVEKKMKTKNTTRRSNTRKYASHASQSTPVVTSETTLCVKQDEDADCMSNKPTTSIDDPLKGSVALSSSGFSEESAATSSPKPHVKYISDNHKKSRRSSRIHQVSNLPANPEQNTPVENGAAMLPHLADHSDSSMNDFCLPIDEPLQFSQEEKKVRRSMRLRRDSGIVGLSWVQEINNSDTVGRRKSLNSVMRCEESSESSVGHSVPSPNKENLNSHHVPNIARKTRRRTLCTVTIQESVSACDPKRRRSSCFHKAPNTTSTSDEGIHSTLVPDV